MKRIILVISLTLTNVSFAYQELASYRKLQVPLDHKKTWVIFDIDNTLLRPTSEIGSHQWADYMANRYLKAGHTDAEANVYQTQIFSRAQKFVNPVVVDASIYDFINKLKIQRVPFLALTARSSLVLKETTIQQMRSIELLPAFDQSHPTWNSSIDISSYTQQGIVFSNGLQKGEILKKLIDAANDKPDRIIFIDDRDYNVKSIEKAGAEIGIEVIGYRFSATDQIIAQFNKRKADQEWFAAKYLSSPSEATALNKPDSLGKSLMYMEFGVWIIPYSDRCSILTIKDFIQLNCKAEIAGYYGEPQLVQRSYSVNYNLEDQFYTKLDWDLF